jgi:hypothetical protein
VVADQRGSLPVRLWPGAHAAAYQRGFTVSLSRLIGDLAYTGRERFERVTTAVLIASLIASGSAAVAFRIRVHQRARTDGKENT